MGGSPLSLQKWGILQAGHISLRWHRGHLERREKKRALWSREDWGLYLSKLAPPPRASPYSANCPSIPILQIILTDIPGIR